MKTKLSRCNWRHWTGKNDDGLIFLSGFVSFWKWNSSVILTWEVLLSEKPTPSLNSISVCGGPAWDVRGPQLPTNKNSATFKQKIHRLQSLRFQIYPSIWSCCVQSANQQRLQWQQCLHRQENNKMKKSSSFLFLVKCFFHQAEVWFPSLQRRSLRRALKTFKDLPSREKIWRWPPPRPWHDSVGHKKILKQLSQTVLR